MKIDRITRQNAKTVVQEVLTAVEQEIKAAGLTAKVVGSVKFEDSRLVFKLELATENSVPVEAEEFIQYAKSLGITKVLGEVVKYGGELYKIEGLSLRSRKCPVWVERVSDGKKYKLPLDAVRGSNETVNR